MPTPIYGPLSTVPGGMTVSVTGSPPAFSGGQTRTYSNFNTSMFSNVWWGPTGIQAAMDGVINAPGETLTFSSISPDGRTATWTGQTTIPLFNGSSQTVYTRFVAQITGTSGTSTWVAATAPDPDIVGGPPVLIQLDQLLNAFTVNLRFEASYNPSSGFQSFLTLYDNAQTPPGNPPGTSGPALTTFNFGLYAQDNAATDSAPIVSGANSSVSYTEGNPPVALVPSATVFDSEKSGLNGGLGNFSGASISISGMGGDNQITFLSSPLFSFGGGGLMDGSGNVFATFGEVNSLPSLIFTDANGIIPTTALVHAVLHSIAYVNNSRTPNATETMGVIINDGGGNSTPITITVNITDVPNGDGVIGNFVWEDRNLNGVQDFGENGIENVQLRLALSSAPGTIIATAISDFTGHYEFGGLFAGDYIVSVNAGTVDSDFVPTTANQGNDDFDSDFASLGSQVAVHLATDSSIVSNVDLGLYDTSNQAPEADGATFNIDEDQNLFDQLVAIDPDGDPLTYSTVDSPLHGAVTFFGNGHFSYIPNANYFGTDSFTYTVTDGALSSAPATVTINIASLNDVPLLGDITFAVNEDNVYAGTLPVAFDPDGDPQVYSYDFGAQHGTVHVNPNGTFTYTPNANFSGTDSFRYHSNDGTRNSNLATAFVTVNAVNDDPTLATPIADTTAFEDAAFSLSVASAFADVDLPYGDTLTYSATLAGGGALPAWLTFNSTTGTFTGTPLNGDVGSISITVTATDSGGLSVSDTFALTIEDTTGVTITGTSFADTINATTTVAGQPLPTNKNDIITTGGGNDVIAALGGRDTIAAGRGFDTIDAGAGNDTILYVMGDAADTIDGGADDDTLVVTGTNANDNLTVTYNGSAISVLAGGAISNVESVTLDLLGGANALFYSAATTANLSVDLTAGTATGFTSIANVTSVYGGGGNDTLAGTSGVNTLNGGAGNDILIGGAGVDTLIGGSGSDTVVYSYEDARLVIDLIENFTLRFNAGYKREDNLQSIENAIGGSADDYFYGNNSANRFEGGAGNDVFNGGYGADTLLGGTGNDTFEYLINDGADTIDGGSETDALYISGSVNSGVPGNDRLDVVFDGVRITHFEGGTLSDVEQVFANLGGGSDRLHYGATSANVTVNLATGSATGFNSISNIEHITGGAGNDTITGNGLDNSLNGAAGNDILTGGFGNDTFVFTPGLGNDTILDFDGEGGIGAQDFISLVGFGITDAAILATRVAFAEAGSSVVLTVDGTDTITIANATLAGANAISDADFIFAA